MPMMSIITTWEAPGHRPGTFQVLMSCEMCNFWMGMGPRFYPMTCEKHQGNHAETAHFQIPFSAWIVSWSCNKAIRRGWRPSAIPMPITLHRVELLSVMSIRFNFSILYCTPTLPMEYTHCIPYSVFHWNEGHPRIWIWTTNRRNVCVK